jgi:hypothetical protein
MKKEYKKEKMTKKEIKMVQRYFIDSWLMPCSLRSHRIAKRGVEQQNGAKDTQNGGSTGRRCNI